MSIPTHFYSRRVPRRLRTQVRGFSLIEVALALGIIGFVFVSLLGLCSVGVHSNSDSAEAIQASNLVSSLMAHRRAEPLFNPGNALPSDVVALPFLDATRDNQAAPLFIDEAGRAVPSAATAAYRLTYRITQAAAPGGAAKVYLRLTWPAPAAVNTNTSLYENVSFISTSR